MRRGQTTVRAPNRVAALDADELEHVDERLARAGDALHALVAVAELRRDRHLPRVALAWSTHSGGRTVRTVQVGRALQGGWSRPNRLPFLVWRWAADETAPRHAQIACV